jgi:hypothetical protein
MSFFGWLFGRHDGGPRRFVSKAEFSKNLEQAKASPQIVAELRKCGVTDDTKYFFYTNTEPKAQALAIRLKSLGYEVESRPSAGDAGELLISGWTTPIKMSDKAVVTWAEKMCLLGYEYDCDFDGWGTDLPK